LTLEEAEWEEREEYCENST